MTEQNNSTKKPKPRSESASNSKSSSPAKRIHYFLLTLKGNSELRVINQELLSASNPLNFEGSFSSIKKSGQEPYKDTESLKMRTWGPTYLENNEKLEFPEAFKTLENPKSLEVNKREFMPKIEEELEKTQARVKELGEALRIETFNSEELRTYIEILKETIEQKLDGKGLLEVLETLEPSPGMSIHDVVVELQQTRTKIDHSSKETAKASKLREIDQEEKREIEEKNHWLAGQIYDLETCKQDLENELASAKNVLETFKYTMNENEDLKKLIGSLRSEIVDLKGSLEEKINKARSNEHQNELMAQEIEFLKQRNDLLVLDDEELRIKLNETEQKLSDLKRSFENLARENERNLKSSANLEKDLQTTQKFLRQSQSLEATKTQDMEASILQKKRESDELKSELIASRGEVKVLRTQNELLENENLNQCQDLDRLNEKLRSSQERAIELERQNEALREEQFLLKNTVKNLEETILMEQLSKDSVQQALSKEKTISQNLEMKLASQIKEIQESREHLKRLSEKERGFSYFVGRSLEGLNASLNHVVEGLNLLSGEGKNGSKAKVLSKAQNKGRNIGNEEEALGLVDNLETMSAQLKTDIAFFIQNPVFLKSRSKSPNLKNKSSSSQKLPESFYQEKPVARYRPGREKAQEEIRMLRMEIQGLTLDKRELEEDLRDKDLKIVHLQKGNRDLAIEVQKQGEPSLGSRINLHTTKNEKEERPKNFDNEPLKSFSGSKLNEDSQEKDRKKRDYLNDRARELRIQELLQREQEFDGKNNRPGIVKVSDLDINPHDIRRNRRIREKSAERRENNIQERDLKGADDLNGLENAETTKSVLIGGSPIMQSREIKMGSFKEISEKQPNMSPGPKEKISSYKGRRPAGESRYYSLKQSLNDGKISPS